MSSLADSLFAAYGLPVLQEQTGEAALVYLTPRGGEQVGPFDVILDNKLTNRDESDGKKFIHSMVAKFPRQDGLPFWTGASLVGLVATIHDVVWAIELVEDLSDSMATVRLVRLATSEISRPGYRRK